MQHEEMLATIVPDIKDTGFNTVALFFMLFLFVIFFFYFGFELILLPLLSSIDDALVHIYNLERYGSHHCVSAHVQGVYNKQYWFQISD